jgi:hypothetical protein
MPTFQVALPLGYVRIVLNREGLQLSDRGGFEAVWLKDAHDALDEATFHERVKAYLKALYEAEHQQKVPKATLNLATHQLIDDIIGWTRLNYDSRNIE